MKYFQYLKNPLLFPVIFVILHIITYGVFFAITDYNSIEPWHLVERGSLRNLFLFYETNWPNLCGLWIIYGIWSKRIWLTTGLTYLFFIWMENASMGWDVGEFYADSPLIKSNYKIISTDLYFLSNDHTVTSISLFFALVHFTFHVFKFYWRRFHVNHR